MFLAFEQLKSHEIIDDVARKQLFPKTVTGLFRTKLTMEIDEKAPASDKTLTVGTISVCKPTGYFINVLKSALYKIPLWTMKLGLSEVIDVSFMQPTNAPYCISSQSLGILKREMVDPHKNWEGMIFSVDGMISKLVVYINPKITDPSKTKLFDIEKFKVENMLFLNALFCTYSSEDGNVMFWRVA